MWKTSDSLATFGKQLEEQRHAVNGETICATNQFDYDYYNKSK